METGVKRNTKFKGDLSELRLMHDLRRAGYLISIPYGEDHRYDIIAEKDDRFYRVQVKTGRLRRGVVIFNAYSSHAHRGGPSCRLYTNQIDFFGVFCPDNNCSYLVPICELPTNQGYLRVEKPLNNQSRKMRWAEDYLLFSALAAVGNELVGAVAPLALIEPS